MPTYDWLAEVFTRSDMLSLGDSLQHRLNHAKLSEHLPNVEVQGKFDLQPISKVMAACGIVVKPNWLVTPPRIICYEKWIKKEADWHINPDGSLCYVLQSEWENCLSAFGSRYDSQTTIGYATEYLYRNATWLMQRHLIGYQQNIKKWKWGGWSHGALGEKEYLHSRQSKTHKKPT